MAVTQGLFTFPGIQQITGAKFTLSHGIQPSVAIIESVPQSGNPPFKVGDMVITGPDRMVFHDCQIDFGNLSYDRRGRLISFRILDRRWKWEFSGIDGAYNLHTANNKVNTLSAKTPKEMAKLLLEAMNEVGYDIEQIPEPDTEDGNGPEVVWVCANPAVELQFLCEQIGCRIVLGSDDRVRVLPIGEGLDLPQGNVTQADYSVSFDTKPDMYRFCSGPAKFQLRWNLEAVGMDTDGRIKLINDLSYNPHGAGEVSGWVNEQPGAFSGIDATIPDVKELADKTVYRWFRIKNVAGLDKLEIPGYEDFEFNELWQALPLFPFLVETYFEQNNIEDESKTDINQGDEAGQFRFKDATVTGIFYSGSGLQVNTPHADSFYWRDWTLDGERGIIRTKEPTWKYISGIINEPDLYLTCSFHLHDFEKRIAVRREVIRETGGNLGTGPLVLRHEDIEPTHRVEYEDFTNVTKEVHNNDDDVDDAAEYYFDAADRRFVQREEGENEYPGLIDITPDGTIYQVEWETTLKSALTRASKNTERSMFVPPYHIRQRETVGKYQASQNPPDKTGKGQTPHYNGNLPSGSPQYRQAISEP